MQQMKISAFLFDLDGTLAETDSVHFAVFKDILAPFGYDVTDEFYKTHISGKHNPEIFRSLLPESTHSMDVLAFADTKERIFREVITQRGGLVPYHGLREFLQHTFGSDGSNSSFKKAVVTNACRANAEFMLNALDLGDYFDDLIIGDECARGKPDPEPYLEAMRRLGVQPHECVVFEDSPSGIRSAVAAHIPLTIGIASTQEPERLLAAGACAVIHNYCELIPLHPIESNNSKLHHLYQTHVVGKNKHMW